MHFNFHSQLKRCFSLSPTNQVSFTREMFLQCFLKELLSLQILSPIFYSEVKNVFY